MRCSLARTLASAVVCIVAGTAAAHADVQTSILVGGAGGTFGHHHGLRAPHGWFFGADSGLAWLLGPNDVAARTTGGSTSGDPLGWAFGARVGYQLHSGLAVQARYDHFGVDAPDDSGGLQVVSAGVRYSLPIVPMPFAEVLVGPAIHGDSASFAVGIGAGVSVFVARHLALDASVHDWILDLGGIHHVPTVMLGISAGFGG